MGSMHPESRQTPFQQRIAQLQRFVGKAGVVAVLSPHGYEAVLVFAGDSGVEASELERAIQRLREAASPFPVEVRLTKQPQKKVGRGTGADSSRSGE